MFDWLCLDLALFEQGASARVTYVPFLLVTSPPQRSCFGSWRQREAGVFSNSVSCHRCNNKTCVHASMVFVGIVQILRLCGKKCAV